MDEKLAFSLLGLALIAIACLLWLIWNNTIKTREVLASNRATLDTLRKRSIEMEVSIKLMQEDTALIASNVTSPTSIPIQPSGIKRPPTRFDDRKRWEIEQKEKRERENVIY